MQKKNKRAAGIFFLVCATILGTAVLWQSTGYISADRTDQGIIDTYTTEGNGKINDEFRIDWEALLSECPSVAGWVRMDSGANYPVLYSGDNEYYLHRDLYGNYSVNGSIFMDGANDPGWEDRNTVIYGHNMNNGSMFGKNKKYKGKSYAEEHPYFYIYTPEGCGHYRIFAAMDTNDGDEPYTTVFNDMDAFYAYLDRMEQLSTYHLENIDLGKAEKIVTLSTCTNYGKDRFVIQGYLETFVEDEGQK